MLCNSYSSRLLLSANVLFSCSICSEWRFKLRLGWTERGMSIMSLWQTPAAVSTGFVRLIRLVETL